MKFKTLIVWYPRIRYITFYDKREEEYPKCIGETLCDDSDKYSKHRHVWMKIQGNYEILNCWRKVKIL